MKFQRDSLPSIPAHFYICHDTYGMGRLSKLFGTNY